MKRRILSVIMICVFAGAFIAGASEKKTIVLKTYTNVLVNATNNYAVNRQGDLLTYAFATDAGGVVTRITYSYYRKSGASYAGEIEAQYLPTNASDVSVTGLERNVALILFTTLAGERVYMVFRMNKDTAVPKPNKTNFTQKTMGVNETCSMTTKNQILLYTYKTAAMTDLLGILVFNHNWIIRNNKGIDFNPSHGILTAINPPMQKYYKGVIDRGSNLYDIQILRP